MPDPLIRSAESPPPAPSPPPTPGVGPVPDIESLGPMVSEHRGTYFSFLFVGVVLSLPTLWGLYRLVVDRDGLWLGLPIIFGPGAVVCLIWAKVLAARRVALHHFGVVLQDIRGTRLVWWTDLESMTQKITRVSVNFVPVQTTHKYWLTTSDGQRYLIEDNLHRAEFLANEIHGQIARFKLPAMLQDLAAGKTVQFGTLQLDRGGIAYKNTHIPWREVEQIDFRNGIFRVQRRGDKMAKVVKGATVLVNSSSIPNLPLFLELIKRLRTAQ